MKRLVFSPKLIPGCKFFCGMVVVDLTIGYQKLGFICVVVTYSASVIIKLIKMFHSKISP